LATIATDTEEGFTMRLTQGSSSIRLLSVLGGLVLIVAACSSSGASASAPAGVDQPPSAAPSAGGSAAAGGEEYVIASATDATVGAFLTGEDGKTLYIFTPDSANTSACVDACAQSWPPLVVTSTDTLKAGDGVTGKLTTFARPDGTMQVAYNGIPLYYFAKDTKAGDVTGQGVGGKWFAASPTGPLPSASAAVSAY
jgi:predicted lipoprotein with Yx(FWY)xxD motif